MSKKSNRKRSKRKMRPGSTRGTRPHRHRSDAPRVKSDRGSAGGKVSEQDHDPALMLGSETRAAEAVTVLWVLSTLATFASLIGTLTFAMINAFLEKQEETSSALEMLPQWFIMVGAITGFCGLLANFLTTRLRNHQAPYVVKLLSGMVCGLGLAVGLFVK